MAKVLCIEVGCSFTKMVEMEMRQKKPKIYKCVETQTPEGAVRDGYLNPAKTEELKEAVRAALKKGRIRTRRAVFTVFSGRIISREVTLPAVREHQIPAMIEANLNEYFPIELEDYKIAHVLLQTYRDGDRAGQHKVLVMAAERGLIEGYEKLADALGLYIADIDYAGSAVVQAARLNAGTEPIMVVKAEDENALITIMHQGAMTMQRTVNFGPVGGELPDPAEAARVLAGTASRLVDFYASNNGDRRVAQIYLIGEGSRGNDMLRALAEATGINCRTLEHVRGASYSRQADSAKIYLFAAAIGSGIASVGFDKERERERRETNYASACVLMIVLFVAVAAALLTMALIPYGTAEQENESLARKKEQLEPARAVHDRYLGMKNFYLQLAYGGRLTEHSNDGILDFLEELEEKMPAEVELADFSSDDEQCVMTMRVEDKETAAGIIKTLREFSSLESVTVESIIEEEVDDSGDVLEDRDTTVSFTVTCAYAVEEPVAPTVETVGSAGDASAETE